MKVSVPALVCGECHSIMLLEPSRFGRDCKCGQLQVSCNDVALRAISYWGQAPYWMSVEIEVEEAKQ